MQIVVGLWSKEDRIDSKCLEETSLYWPAVVPFTLPKHKVPVHGVWKKTAPNADSWRDTYVLQQLSTLYPEAKAYVIMQDTVLWTEDVKLVLSKVLQWCSQEHKWDVVYLSGIPLWTLYSKTEYIASAPSVWGTYANMYHRQIVPSILKLDCNAASLSNHLSQKPWAKYIVTSILTYPARPLPVLTWGRKWWHYGTTVHSINWTNNKVFMQTAIKAMRDYDYAIIIYFSLILSVCVPLAVIGLLLWSLIMCALSNRECLFASLLVGQTQPLSSQDLPTPKLSKASSRQ